MQIVSNVALISINATLVVQLCSFLIFLVVINRLMFRPLRQVMDEREFHMEEIQRSIQGSEKAYEQALVQIRRKEKEMRAEAAHIFVVCEDEASLEAEHIVGETRQKIEDMRKKAEAEIAQITAAARDMIDAETEDVARLVMENIVDRRLTP